MKLSVLELFGVFFVIEIAVLIISMVTASVLSVFNKTLMRKNYLDILKLDGSLRQKQMEYFKDHPEEYEKWKAAQNMNENNINTPLGTEDSANKPKEQTISQDAINKAIKNAIT